MSRPTVFGIFSFSKNAAAYGACRLNGSVAIQAGISILTPKTAAILHLSRPPKAILSRGPDWGQLSKRVIAPAEAIDEMFKAPGISSLKSCGNQQNSRQRQCVPNLHLFNTQGLYPDVEMFLLPERVSMLASGLIRKEHMRVATAFFNLRNTAVYLGPCQVLALTCVTRSPNISPRQAASLLYPISESIPRFPEFIKRAEITKLHEVATLAVRLALRLSQSRVAFPGHLPHGRAGEPGCVVGDHALMRHANFSVTMDTYVQAVTPAKQEAQRTILRRIEATGAKTKATVAGSSTI